MAKEGCQLVALNNGSMVGLF